MMNSFKNIGICVAIADDTLHVRDHNASFMIHKGDDGQWIEIWK